MKQPLFQWKVGDFCLWLTCHFSIEVVKIVFTVMRLGELLTKQNNPRQSIPKAGMIFHGWSWEMNSFILIYLFVFLMFVLLFLFSNKTWSPTLGVFRKPHLFLLLLGFFAFSQKTPQRWSKIQRLEAKNHFFFWNPEKSSEPSTSMTLGSTC